MARDLQDYINNDLLPSDEPVQLPGTRSNVYTTQPVAPPVFAPGPGTPNSAVYAQPGSPIPAEATKPKLSAQDFIKQWQQTHKATEGVGPLTEAMKAAGYNVSPYMYGSTSSNNEISLDGQKYKVISGEDSPNTAAWYAAGTVEGGGGNNPFQQRIDSLGQAPDRTALDAFIQSMLDKEKGNQVRAQQVASTFRTRAAELNQPAYSAGDEAAMRARMFDQFERRRAETLNNDREGIYARGFAPTSGLVQDATNRTNDRFEQARTGMESTLLNQAITEGQSRKDHAVQLEAMAQSALEGGDITSLNYQGQVADQEDRMIQDTNARERERLATYGAGEDLNNSHIQQALQILGQGGNNSSSALNSILGLGQYGNQANAQNTASRNSNMAGWGSLASLILNLYGGAR